MRYRFKCEKCCETFEYEMTFEQYDEFIKEPRCGKCGGTLVREYGSVPQVIYNQMGFYTTNKELEDKQVKKIMDYEM